MSKPSVIKGTSDELPTLASILRPVGERLGIVMQGGKPQGAVGRGYEAGFNQGLEDGAKEGYLLGHAQAKAEMQDSIRAEMERFRFDLQTLHARIEEALPEWCRKTEEILTDRVTTIAERVVLANLALDRDAVLSIVRDALKEITHATHATIRVNPNDLQTLAAYREELARCAESLRGIEFVDDPTISGGAVIETDGGTIDASVEGKVAALDFALKEAA